MRKKYNCFGFLKYHQARQRQLDLFRLFIEHNLDYTRCSILILVSRPTPCFDGSVLSFSAKTSQCALETSEVRRDGCTNSQRKTIPGELNLQFVTLMM